MTIRAFGFGFLPDYLTLGFFSLSFSALPQEVEAEGEVLSVSDFNAATDSVSLDEPPTDGASPSKGTEI